MQISPVFSCQVKNVLFVYYTESTDIFDELYGHKYCNASTTEFMSTCTIYYNQSVTFICTCVDEQCSTTWKLWRSIFITKLNYTGQRYTINSVTNFNADKVTCESNNQILHLWSINILQFGECFCITCTHIHFCMHI